MKNKRILLDLIGVNFLNLFLLSFYAININSSFKSDRDKELEELEAYSEVNPDYARIIKRRLECWKNDKPTGLSSIKNNDSSFISKDRVSEELLMKAALVFNYINYLEHVVPYFSPEKSEVHNLLAKIAQPENSRRRSVKTEENYKQMGADTTLTEKELEYITEWFNERYAAIKDQGLSKGLYDTHKYYERLDAQERKLEAQERFEKLANYIKSYRSLKNQDYLKNWHPYQKYWDKKYKISNFEKELLDSNPFL